MQAPVKHIVLEQTLWLSTARTAFWEETKTLIAADLHFGKTGYFRKSSIAVPQTIFKKDLQQLFQQIQFYNPTQLIIAGDMFHSEANLEMELFKKWRNDISPLPIKLVMGNHDILHKTRYEDMDIEVIDDSLRIKPFTIMHQLPEQSDANSFIIAGHVHPGIVINGLGKQSLRFPCYYFTQKYLLMPAFSDFTGLHCIRPKAGENVFAILPNNAGNNQSGSVIKIH